MNKWPCGTDKSGNNAFTGACLEDRPPAVLRAVSGPRKRSPTVHLPGSLAMDIRGHAVVPMEPKYSGFEIYRNDGHRTARIKKASI